MSSSHDHPTESLVAPADRGSKPVRARLRAIAPRGVTWELEIGAHPVTLGRTPEDVTPPLIHGTVSRRHARLHWDAARRCHVVEDLGSRHGTHVDQLAAGTGLALPDGAILRLGGVFLAFERLVDDADPADVSHEQLPGDAPVMIKLRAAIAFAAGDPSPVLVIGDTGTGKEWVANELHRLSRRKGALIAVNCAALTPQLVESQLFGHVKGAFTGATTDEGGLFRAADGGTLFLDEVGELPVELQPKLLRVLQDGVVQPVGGTRTTKVDVRVIAATNRDLAIAAAIGGFRRDLYARLAKWELTVPRLTERRGDLPAWLDRLWLAWCTTRQVARPLPELSAAATAALLSHAWPDNLRGLDRLIHALASRGTTTVIELGDLPEWLRESETMEMARVDAAGVAIPLPAKLPVPTRDEFETAWRELGGNVRALGRRFGRDRRQIYRWADTYGLRTAGTPDDPVDEG